MIVWILNARITLAMKLRLKKPLRACRVLDELLPPGQSLGERINTRKSALVVPIGRLRPKLLKILDCLLISL
jgi:hypothetical protein